jgi:hypothetical protein
VLKLISDENFDGDILRGLYRRRPELDIVRVQDVGGGRPRGAWRLADLPLTRTQEAQRQGLAPHEYVRQPWRT